MKVIPPSGDCPRSPSNTGAKVHRDLASERGCHGAPLLGLEYQSVHLLSASPVAEASNCVGGPNWTEMSGAADQDSGHAVSVQVVDQLERFDLDLQAA